MKSKLEKLYFILGILDILLGAVEIGTGTAEGRASNVVLGAGFIMIGTVNIFSSRKMKDEKAE